MKTAMVLSLSVAAAADMACPGSPAPLFHAKTQVTATAKASCADVKAEIVARASAQKGWADPHNGGIYGVISDTDTVINTNRTTNPKTSVGHKVYLDKQVFTLADNAGSCDISACSESQGTSGLDFSTNYCDLRNLYCGAADGCKPLLKDFTSTENSVISSSHQHDWSQCIVKPNVTAVADVTCPGSPAPLFHAKTQVTATAKASCAEVKAEIVARGSAQKGWVDPHNGGIYNLISDTDAMISTNRTTNPKTSVGHKVYLDQQLFTLTDNAGSCDISACSESQGTSGLDFSTNYCDLRNLYCGTADGCKSIVNDFTSTESSVKSSSHQHDWSKCIVKPNDIIV